MTDLERNAKDYADNIEGETDGGYACTFEQLEQAFKDGYKQGREDFDVHWHSVDEIPTNEEGKTFTVNVLNNFHQIVYYSFSEGCWIDDISDCEADKFDAWMYLPIYKGEAVDD